MSHFEPRSLVVVPFFTVAVSAAAKDPSPITLIVSSGRGVEREPERSVA